MKWRNWKIVFYDEQRDWWSPHVKLGSPKAFDLITGSEGGVPCDCTAQHMDAGPAMRVIEEFQQSLRKYPPIAPGTPDPYTPPY